ncbi:MAG: hypothetical protein P1P87_03810 [Trueperaceae bacterium]|nr:hypothetical protein [Trueperaceae bacterium]
MGTGSGTMDRRRRARVIAGGVGWLLAIAAAVACAPVASPAAVAANGADGPPSDARILSAYYGLAALPAHASLACLRRVTGEDGMPVTFSVQHDAATVTPDAFAVETATGELVTPLCATLRPATEPLERRTVLLAGPFGTPDAPPRAVVVGGGLADAAGRSLVGFRSDAITPLEAGPSLVLAERFDPDTVGLTGECLTGTQQVVQLVWEGGVTGPQDAALGEPQRLGVRVALEDGAVVAPVTLADDDPDNFVLACLGTAVPARSVAVDAGLFFDPGDDPNPATRVEVVTGGGVD